MCQTDNSEQRTYLVIRVRKKRDTWIKTSDISPVLLVSDLDGRALLRKVVRVPNPWLESRPSASQRSAGAGALASLMSRLQPARRVMLATAPLPRTTLLNVRQTRPHHLLRHPPHFWDMSADPCASMALGSSIHSRGILKNSPFPRYPCSDHLGLAALFVCRASRSLGYGSAKAHDEERHGRQ